MTVSLKIDGVTLSVTCHIHKQSKFFVICLHGGGVGSKERFLNLQQFLHQNKISSCAFDARGVGESTGRFEDGSLYQRQQDAIAVIKYIQNQYKPQEIIVLGSSMGGHIAAKLAMQSKQLHIQKIILLYAGAYSQSAEDKMLNQEFTQEITKKDSWKTSPAFTAIKEFAGKTLVLYGKNDTIIPYGVKQSFKNALRDKKYYIEYSNTDHIILKNKKIKHQIFNDIYEFIIED